jgi:secreted trypsin-like serine protease
MQHLFILLIEAVSLFYSVDASRHTDSGQKPRRSLQKEARIVGGTPAEVGEFPSFVWTAGSQICGGSVIWDDIVLTAAHCAGFFIERGIIYNGVMLNGGAGELFRGVDAELPHPDYNITQQDANDIMLVKTNGALGLPLQELNFDSNFPESGVPAVVAGFGRTEATGSISDILLWVDVPIVDFETCNAIFKRIVDDVMICAGAEAGKDCK